jgi:hypothetical protein
VRKLAAIEALSRYGKAQGRMLASITVAPNQWPTHSVIDWLNILRRVQDVPQREQRLAEASKSCKARLSYQGTKLLFSTEQDDYWWWLMQNGDVNTARLLLAVMDDPAWKDDMGRLANGFISRQQGGAWHTTTANLWGGLALEKFSAKFEATPVSGTTRASLGGASASVDWSKVERIKAQRRQRRRAPDHLVWCTGSPRHAARQRHVPALGCGQGAAFRRTPGAGQALAHRAIGGGHRAQGTVQRGLPHRQDGDSHRAGQQGAAARPVHARRRVARDLGGHQPDRHDLGRHHRPDPRGQPPSWAAAWGAIPRSPPRARSAAAPAGLLSRSAASRPSAATTNTCPRAPSRWSTPCA